MLRGHILNRPTCGMYLQLDADAAGLPHPGDLGPQFDMLMQELQGGVGIGGHEDGMHEGRKSTKPACLFLFLLHRLCPGFILPLTLLPAVVAPGPSTLPVGLLLLDTVCKCHDLTGCEGFSLQPHNLLLLSTTCQLHHPSAKAHCSHVLVLCLTVCLTDTCLSLLGFLLQTQRVKMRRSLTRILRLRVRVLRMTMRMARGPATQMRRMLTCM